MIHISWWLFWLLPMIGFGVGWVTRHEVARIQFTQLREEIDALFDKFERELEEARK